LLLILYLASVFCVLKMNWKFLIFTFCVVCFAYGFQRYQLCDHWRLCSSTTAIARVNRDHKCMLSALRAFSDNAIEFIDEEIDSLTYYNKAKHNFVSMIKCYL
jgi:hypothetical protein